jgi:hypothetical protein
MRSTADIVAYIDKEDLNGGPFAFHREVLVPYLPFEDAARFLKPDTKKEDWVWVLPTEQERIGRQEMAEYMHFAWEKVRDHRGLSAGRNIEKMRAWDWLLSEEGNELNFDALPYAQYGAPVLAAICTKYNLQIPLGEGFQNMIAGRPCEPGCDQGCGK